MDNKEYKKLNNAYLAGELIFDVKYRHNSQVKITDEEGKKGILESKLAK